MCSRTMKVQVLFRGQWRAPKFRSQRVEEFAQDEPDDICGGIAPASKFTDIQQVPECLPQFRGAFEVVQKQYSLLRTFL